MKKYVKILLIIFIVIAAFFLSRTLTPDPLDLADYVLLGVPSVNSTLIPRQGQVQFSADTKPIS